MASGISRLGKLLGTNRKWTWIIGGSAVVILVALAVSLGEGNGGSAADTASQYVQAPQDVKVVSCSQAGGSAQATLRVHNSSADESNYALDIAFQNPDGHTIYDTKTLIIPELASNATSSLQKIEGPKVTAAQPLACVVARAARYGE